MRLKGPWAQALSSLVDGPAIEGFGLVVSWRWRRMSGGGGEAKRALRWPQEALGLIGSRAKFAISRIWQAKVR